MAIKYVFNPFTGNFDTISVEAAAFGGKYGINVETLTGNKTLTPNIDEIYQHLTAGTASRVITLDTASATIGDRFYIFNNDAYNSRWYLSIKQGGVELDRAYTSAHKAYIFDGTDWRPNITGTAISADSKFRNIAIGQEANARLYGVAVGKEANADSSAAAVGYAADGHGDGVAMGYEAYGYTQGVGIGRSANGSSRGIGIGYRADGASYGIALGYYTDTNSKRWGAAIGYYSECTRWNEIAFNIGANSSQKDNITIIGFRAATLNNTPVEMFVGGSSPQRVTIRAQSALTFKIMVTARDNTSGDCAAYMFDGLIKRDGAGNTTMSVCNKTVTHEDDATWDCDVTADDTNEALIITVTGDAANTVQWTARLDGVETHF